MTSPLKRQSFFVICYLIMSLDSTQFVSSNFKQLDPQDVTILEEYVGTIAQQRFEDCAY